MTTGEWISLGSSIGAMSAVLVALFTLLELSRQRKSSYKPDICVLKKNFDITLGFIGKTSNLPFALDWVPQGMKQQKSIEAANIRILNVGFGVAKKVKATWKFDLKSLIEEVNQLAQQTYQTYYFVQQEAFLSVMSKGKSIYRANIKMDSFQFEYLLPIAYQPKGHDILLPPAYIVLVSSYLALCVKAKRQLSEIQASNISLELSFIDIGKEKHVSNHKLTINIMMIAGSDDEESVPQFGIEFVEIA